MSTDKSFGATHTEVVQICPLTHGFELRNELLLGPLLLLAPQGDRVGDDYLVVVGVGHVQVVDEHNVRVLQEPVAAPVERGQDGAVDVAPVDALKPRIDEGC